MLCYSKRVINCTGCEKRAANNEQKHRRDRKNQKKKKPSTYNRRWLELSQGESQIWLLREQWVILCCTTSTDVWFSWRQEKSERTQRCAQAQQPHRSQREGEHITATDRHLGMFCFLSLPVLHSPKCISQSRGSSFSAVKLVKRASVSHVCSLLI